MPKTLIPENFTVTPEMREWARLKVASVNIDEQTEWFCDYWRAHGKKMMDWTATWRNWMRRSIEFSRPVTRYSQVERAKTPKPAECRHGLEPASCVYCRRSGQQARAP